MKKVFFIIILLQIQLSCSSNNIAIKTNNEKTPNFFKQFDKALFLNDHSTLKRDESDGLFLLEDKIKFQPLITKNKLGFFVIPPSPAFYSYNYQYYSDTGNLKSVGKELAILGDVKIGIWEYYDEEGEIIKKVNEDVKFGKFGYNKLLRFLDKEKVINLKTGKNRDSDNLTIFYNEQDKIWTVIIYTEILNKYHHKGWEYKIDSNTGKVLEKKWLDEEIVI